MLLNEITALSAALAWHLDAGADWALLDTPRSFLDRPSAPPQTHIPAPSPDIAPAPQSAIPLGTAEARAQAVSTAKSAQTLEELRTAIAAFDGIGLKNTATNLVFAAGVPESGIMLIGDVPGAQDDRTGRPFSGVDGDWLDRALTAAGLDRHTHIYSTTFLNWRPPGNRSPNDAELALSLPFIERHIQLVGPRFLILCGAIPAQNLLGRTESFSRLRGSWHDYTPRTAELLDISARPIPAIVTHHPESLGKTPAQKRGFWGDILKILEKRAELGFS
jgi:DNA polymerase